MSLKCCGRSYVTRERERGVNEGVYIETLILAVMLVLAVLPELPCLICMQAAELSAFFLQSTSRI